MGRIKIIQLKPFSFSFLKIVRKDRKNLNSINESVQQAFKGKNEIQNKNNNLTISAAGITGMNSNCLKKLS